MFSIFFSARFANAPVIFCSNKSQTHEGDCEGPGLHFVGWSRRKLYLPEHVLFLHSTQRPIIKTLSLCMLLCENYGIEMARKGKMMNPISEVIIKVTGSFREVAKRHPGIDTYLWA